MKINLKKEKKSKIGLIIFISYFIYNLGQLIPLKIIGINYSNMSIISKVIYLLSYEFTYILILFFVYRKIYIKDFKKFINNFKNYIMKYMEYWALSFGLMLISNIIITSVFPNSSASNQEILNSTFAIAPIYILISASLFAPLIEETIFRLSLRNVFKTDKLFIIISGLVFGALHVVGSFNSFSELLYIIPYSIPGFVFAYTLVKSKNIFVPISLHMFHNTLMVLVQFILMYFI